jgi:hypothetical protein
LCISIGLLFTKFSQEVDEIIEDIEDSRSTLLMMNFSVEEVEFAIRKLGM